MRFDDVKYRSAVANIINQSAMVREENVINARNLQGMSCVAVKSNFQRDNIRGVRPKKIDIKLAIDEARNR